MVRRDLKPRTRIEQLACVLMTIVALLSWPLQIESLFSALQLPMLQFSPILLLKASASLLPFILVYGLVRLWPLLRMLFLFAALPITSTAAHYLA